MLHLKQIFRKGKCSQSFQNKRFISDTDSGLTLIYILMNLLSGVSDTESESGNASDRGYTSDRDDQPTEILSLVSFQVNSILNYL